MSAWKPLECVCIQMCASADIGRVGDEVQSFCFRCGHAFPGMQAKCECMRCAVLPFCPRIEIMWGMSRGAGKHCKFVHQPFRACLQRASLLGHILEPQMCRLSLRFVHSVHAGFPSVCADVPEGGYSASQHGNLQSQFRVADLDVKLLMSMQPVRKSKVVVEVHQL